MADSQEVPGDYINQRKDLHDCFFLVGTKHKERFSSVKLFLANHSPYFRAMLFETNMKEKNSKEDIIIPDLEPDVFKLMLRYVYGCHVVNFKDIDQAMRCNILADKCLMPKLKDITSIYLTEHCTSNTDILECACLLGVNQLEPRAQKIIQEETNTLLSSKDFVELNSNIVLFMVKQEKLSVSEVELWKAVLKWARYQCNNSNNGSTIRAKMGSILPFIRFLVMSPKDFAKEVVTASVLTTEESLAVFVAMSTEEDLKLASLSKTRKERISSRIEFSICSTVRSGMTGVMNATHVYSFAIHVHSHQLYLKSITLFQNVFDITIKLLKDDQTIKQTSHQSVNPNGDISFYTDFFLDSNQTYKLLLQTSSRAFFAAQVGQREVCNHCSITFNNLNNTDECTNYFYMISTSMQNGYDYSPVKQLHFMV